MAGTFDWLQLPQIDPALIAQILALGAEPASPAQSHNWIEQIAPRDPYPPHNWLTPAATATAEGAGYDPFDPAQSFLSAGSGVGFGSPSLSSLASAAGYPSPSAGNVSGVRGGAAPGGAGMSVPPTSPLPSPQPISPLVNGGQLPAIPPGGLPAAGGGGFWDKLKAWAADPATGQSLISAGGAMMQAAAPSLDPRSGSLANALGAGLQGYQARGDVEWQKERDELNDWFKQRYMEASSQAMQLKPFDTYDEQGRVQPGLIDLQGNWRPVGSPAPLPRTGAGGTGRLSQGSYAEAMTLGNLYNSAVDAYVLADGLEKGIAAGGGLGGNFPLLAGIGGGVPSAMREDYDRLRATTVQLIMVQTGRTTEADRKNIEAQLGDDPTSVIATAKSVAERAALQGAEGVGRIYGQAGLPMPGWLQTTVPQTQAPADNPDLLPE